MGSSSSSGNVMDMFCFHLLPQTLKIVKTIYDKCNNPTLFLHLLQSTESQLGLYHFLIEKRGERRKTPLHHFFCQPRYEGFCIFAFARLPNPRRSMAFSVLKDSPILMIGLPFFVFPTIL